MNRFVFPLFLNFNSIGSRLGEKLKKIDSKNMLFFPSKNLTRPSIENIYGPVKKRSPSTLRQNSNSLKSTTNSSNENTKPQSTSQEIEKTKSQKAPLEKEQLHKTPIEEDTPRPAVAKGANNQSKSSTKRGEPKILAPLMVFNKTDKKKENTRPTGPVKAKPFMASGCGKGIPSIENLPKPKIGSK